MTGRPRLPEVSAVTRGQGEVRLSLAIPPDLAWFEGHFASLPILPGVVQIDWALAFARQHLALALPTARRFKVKFRSVIGPGDVLTLTLAHRAARGELSFEYRRADIVCSSGQLRVAP